MNFLKNFSRQEIKPSFYMEAKTRLIEKGSFKTSKMESGILWWPPAFALEV
jgi:hypothetical protein